MGMKPIHGMSKTKTYKAWHNMLSRCYLKCSNNYHNYGGRGIKVCKRWKKFINFYNDMQEAPSNKSLERNDNEKGYSKDNCCWATKAEQERNKRRIEPNNMYIGVRKIGNNYSARIKKEGKEIHLGMYKDIKVAAECYDLAAFLYFKDRRFKNKKILGKI